MCKNQIPVDLALTNDFEVYFRLHRCVHAVGGPADVDAAVDAGHVAEDEGGAGAVLLAVGKHAVLKIMGRQWCYICAIRTFDNTVLFNR